MGGGEILTVVIYLAYIGGGIWVLWKFYRALVRIGEELAEIKVALRPHLTETEQSSPH
jgi:hypothetical protein